MEYLKIITTESGNTEYDAPGCKKTASHGAPSVGRPWAKGCLYEC